MKVLVADLDIMDEQFSRDLESSFPDVDFIYASSPSEQLTHIKEADVYLGYPSREILLEAENLRWIACTGTGIDTLVSIPELINSEIVLTNARGSHAEPMANHTIGMILAFAHRMNETMADQRAHRWDTMKYNGRIIQLSGQTMGLFGLGDIGRAIARKASAFGLKVLAVNKTPVDPPPRGVDEVWGVERIDDLMKLSDWFVVTVPLTKNTYGVIDKRRIKFLKSDSRIIVISRGGIVNEDDLIEALSSKSIAGAGLDSTIMEPLPSDSPLWDMSNVIISPHISALTPEMWQGRKDIFKENLSRFINGEPFTYVCDKKAGY